MIFRNIQPESPSFISKMLDEPKPDELDYIADFAEENGMYHHECIRCGREFIGHKRRVICKQCYKEKPEHELRNLQNELKNKKE